MASSFQVLHSPAERRRKDAYQMMKAKEEAERRIEAEYLRRLRRRSS
jgi:hypothetical protein